MSNVRCERRQYRRPSGTDATRVSAHRPRPAVPAARRVCVLRLCPCVHQCPGPPSHYATARACSTHHSSQSFVPFSLTPHAKRLFSFFFFKSPPPPQILPFSPTRPFSD